MFLYKALYKEKLYNYLITDNYYCKSFLYMNTLSNIRMSNIKTITHSKKLKAFSKIIDFNNWIILENDYTSSDIEIENIFSLFIKNDFRKNSICEVILGK